MYLVDTNVWLERQDKSDEARRFLEMTPPPELYITDFSFHSIGVVLARFARLDVLLDFTRDLFIETGVNLIGLTPEDVPDLAGLIGGYKLDLMMPINILQLNRTD